MPSTVPPCVASHLSRLSAGRPALAVNPLIETTGSRPQSTSPTDQRSAHCTPRNRARIPDPRNPDSLFSAISPPLSVSVFSSFPSLSAGRPALSFCLTRLFPGTLPQCARSFPAPKKQTTFLRCSCSRSRPTHKQPPCQHPNSLQRNISRPKAARKSLSFLRIIRINDKYPLDATR